VIFPSQIWNKKKIFFWYEEKTSFLCEKNISSFVKTSKIIGRVVLDSAELY